MTNLARRLRYELPKRADLNLLFQMKATPTSTDGEILSLAPYLQASGFLPTPPWKGAIREFEARFQPRKAP